MLTITKVQWLRQDFASETKDVITMLRTRKPFRDAAGGTQRGFLLRGRVCVVYQNRPNSDSVANIGLSVLLQYRSSYDFSSQKK